LNRPVLPYLDVTILGIGAFLSCGRIGCLLVGCCHGRPSPWGIRYREEHARQGFAPHLVNITLFPIQALESLWVLMVVCVGVFLVWRSQPAGNALEWYTVGYGVVRFILEFIRGDIERPYTFGFSQGQWLSLWLISALVWGEWAGQVPFHAWHSVALAALVMVMTATTLYRKHDRSQRFRILHPHHVSEVAALVGGTPAVLLEGRHKGRSCVEHVGCTSAGIQISQGRVEDPAAVTNHYTFSSRDGAMSQASALLLAELILRLQRESRPSQVFPGDYGVFHLLLVRNRDDGQGHA